MVAFSSKPIEYKNSTFYCNSCKKMVRGNGYLLNALPLCTKHYWEKFKKEK